MIAQMEKGIDLNGFVDMFKALGHPIRLRIILELMESDKSVSELWHVLGVSQTLVSQHLAVLRHSGIIKSFRRGNTVYYSVLNPIVVEIFKLIQKQNLKEG
jgi:ArsR family transcriptional regulator